MRASFKLLFDLSIPLIFQVVSDEQQVIDEVYNNLLNISENRLVEKHEHEDQLYEIGMIVSRINSIVFSLSKLKYSSISMNIGLALL